MDYATTDKRAASAAQRHKAKAAAQERRAVPAATGQKEGCRRGAKEQAAISPCGLLPMVF